MATLMIIAWNIRFDKRAHISISSLKIGGFSLEENFTKKSNFHVFTEKRIRKVFTRNIFRGKITTFFVEQSAM